MFTASIKFPSREAATVFAVAWSRYALRGYSIGPKKADGCSTVTLDNVTPTDRQWINNRVAMMNAKAESLAEA